MAYMVSEENNYQVVIVDRLLPGVGDNCPPEKLGLIFGPILLDEALAGAGLCRHPQVYVIRFLIGDGAQCGGGSSQTLRGQGLLHHLAFIYSPFSFNRGCGILLPYNNLINL